MQNKQLIKLSFFKSEDIYQAIVSLTEISHISEK